MTSDLVTEWREQAKGWEKTAQDWMVCALAAEAKLAKAREALKTISLGTGPFSRDPLKHAENVIEESKELARAALKEIDDAT